MNDMAIKCQQNNVGSFGFSLLMAKLVTNMKLNENLIKLGGPK